VTLFICAGDKMKRNEDDKGNDFDTWERRPAEVKKLRTATRALFLICESAAIGERD